MAPTKESEKDRESEAKRSREAKRQTVGTLPVGHPQAGYAAPLLDGELDTGILPDEEQEWREERIENAEEENEAIAESESKVAREEIEARDKEMEERGRAAEEQEKAKRAALQQKGGTGSTSSSTAGPKASQ
jgi:hypothetical protein